MTDVRGRRLALLVATDTYDDPALTKLNAPAPDAAALADVLSDEMLGGFEVEILSNATSSGIAEHLEDLLSTRRPDDVVFLHFACHGVKDADGQLHLAARNTRTGRLASTAVSAGLLRQLMTQSRAGVIVVMLDCCYGGAFSDGVRAKLGEQIDITDNFAQQAPPGRGRVVITAASATEYAFEGDELTDIGVRTASVFTNCLIDGIRTGEADLDQDGVIGIGELYQYLYDRVSRQRPGQTPSKWEIYVRGNLDIARSPLRRALPTRLPPEIDGLLDHRSGPDTRVFGVRGLISLVDDDNLQLAAAARLRLVELADDDSVKVSREARAGLAKTGLKLSATRVDLGVLSFPYAGPPAEVRLLGGPLVGLSSVRADPRLRARIDDNRLLIKAVTADPGRLEASVTVTGPAGDARLTVTGWVAPAPGPLLREAEHLARTVAGPVDRALGFALLAAMQSLVGDPARTPELLTEAERSARAVPDSRWHASVTAAIDLIGGLAGDPLRGGRAIGSLAEVLRIVAGNPVARTVLLGGAALLAAWSGDPAQTTRILDEARRAAADVAEPTLRRGLTLLVDWLAARLGGRSAGVVDDLRELVEQDIANPLGTALALAALVWVTAEDAGPAQLMRLAAASPEWAPVLTPSAATLVWVAGDTDATDLVTRARAAADQVSEPSDRVAALAGTALAAHWSGARQAAADALAAADAAAAGITGNLEDRATAMAILLLAEAWTGDRSRTADRIGEGHTAANAGETPEGRVTNLAMLALAAAWTGHRAEADRILVDAEAAARAVSASEDVQWAVFWVDLAGRLAGDRQRGARLLDDLSALIRSYVSDGIAQATVLSAVAWLSAGPDGAGLPGPAAFGLRLLTLLVGAGDAATTARLHELARDAAHADENPFWRATALAVAAVAEAWTGDRSQAYRTLAECRIVARQVADPAGQVLAAVIATVAGAWAGDGVQVSRHGLDEAEQAAQDLTDPVLHDRLRLLIDVAAAVVAVPDRSGRIAADLRAVIESGVEDPAGRAALLAGLAWLTSHPGGPADALPGPAGPATGVRARLAGTVGDVTAGADTAALLADARAAAEAVPPGYVRALVLLVVAFAHAQGGRRADAEPMLAEVREIARGLVDEPYPQTVLLALAAWVGQAGAFDGLLEAAVPRLRTLWESLRHPGGG